MAVKILVSELRREISRRNLHPNENLTISAIPREIFDETVAILLGSDQGLNFLGAIQEVEPVAADWVRALTVHTYHRLVGPRLQARQALLHQQSDQILLTWDAVQEFCRWLAGELLRIYHDGDGDLTGTVWRRVEDPVTLELSHPAWSDKICLQGEIGSAWYSPVDQQWISIAMTGGATASEADLIDTALTQLLLTKAGQLPRPTAKGVRRLHFSPVFVQSDPAATDLQRYQESLIDLSGQLAGVSGGTGRVARKVATPGPVDTVAAGQRIVTILNELGVASRLDQPAFVAPAFLRVSIVVEGWRKTRQLEQLATEIQIELGLERPPLLGHDGERLLIDLPRPDRREVTFDQILTSIPHGDPLTGSARAPLGLDVDGRLRLIDFSRPEDAHLLIAGRTGSGKTEWIRTAIAGLTSANSPETLRLLLVDPEGYAFDPWRASSFLEGTVIDTWDRALSVLVSLGDEMEHRYSLMQQAAVGSVSELAEKLQQPVPRIFFICDEYTGLITTNRQKRQLIEQQLSRLGQRARAAGIHLIIATRHPGREVMRGALNSIIPARVGMQMSKGIESKILLNQPGAERLLGDGDLLFRDGGGLIRLQGAIYVLNSPLA